MKDQEEDDTKLADAGLWQIKHWFEEHFEAAFNVAAKGDLEGATIYFGDDAGDIFISTEATRNDGDMVLVKGVLDDAIGVLCQSLQEIGAEKMNAWADYLEEAAKEIRDAATTAAPEG